ncbi:MAG: anthranilate phosphoribosyltransferase [Pseudomonadota bacterium]|nr:anthranilate phosphoribosyltransferase [Pseudomonadota bacterium]
MSTGDFSDTLKAIVAGRTLGADEAARAFAAIMAGEVSQVRIAAFLTGLAVRGPSVEEITGAARAMRAAMRKVTAPAHAMDIVGTGGDGHDTFNISTATALTVAACGVPVAKHGNRSASSRTGTADVLEKLGVKIEIAPPIAEACLQEAGICFLFAAAYHSAMKHVAPVRKELGFRTIFNFLGPLSNPAQVARYLLGVSAPEWVEKLAYVLKALGAEKAWVVRGADGLDELTTTGLTHVAILDAGRVTLREVMPEEIGVSRVPLAALKGGEAEENAAALRALLDGAPGAFRDVVRLNAAAALVVADKAADLAAGAKLAAEAIDSGAAKATLARLVEVSQRAAP